MQRVMLPLSRGYIKFIEKNNIDLNSGESMMLLMDNMNYRVIIAHKLV